MQPNKNVRLVALKSDKTVSQTWMETSAASRRKIFDTPLLLSWCVLPFKKVAEGADGLSS